MGSDEDIKDLSGGDCDAPNSWGWGGGACVCVESHIGHILG